MLQLCHRSTRGCGVTQRGGWSDLIDGGRLRSMQLMPQTQVSDVGRRQHRRTRRRSGLLLEPEEQRDIGDQQEKD
jgi:hypothetical protein